MRRLIINADDFGLTAGVNRAIVEAHQGGVVTSATMMANAPAIEDAIERAKRSPRLQVGCHVVLIDGAPLLSPGQVPSLLHGCDGARFRSSWLDFATTAMCRRLRPAEISAEVEAQIRSLQGAGVRLSHVDSHKHVHLLPPVLRPLLQAAKACGVRAVRNPFVPVKPLAMAHLLRRPRLWGRYSELRLLRRFADEFRESVSAAGMVTTDGTFGIVVTGALDERLFKAIVGSLPEGTWEFVCHPGYDDEDLHRAGTRLRQSRPQELAVLQSAAARQAIESAGVELIAFGDL